MSYRLKTIRRSQAQIRKYMRAYNDLDKALWGLRKLIDDEVKLYESRKKSKKSLKEEAEEAEGVKK